MLPIDLVIMELVHLVVRFTWQACFTVDTLMRARLARSRTHMYTCTHAHTHMHLRIQEIAERLGKPLDLMLRLSMPKGFLGVCVCVCHMMIWVLRCVCHMMIANSSSVGELPSIAMFNADFTPHAQGRAC